MNTSLSRRLMILGSLAAMAGGNTRAETRFNGLDLSKATYGRDFHLKDTQGHERQLADYRGKLVLLHFGFTLCPDACPTTLARAVEVKSILGEHGKQLQVLFVTLDPERDTAPLISAYTAAFDPSFVGLRGDVEQTRAVAKEFKVFYRKVPTGSSYTLEHGTNGFAFDPSGRLRVAVRHEATAQECAQDLRQLFS